MGTCLYCGQPTGLLRQQHKECREKHDAAATKIPEFFVKALDSSLDPARFHALTQDVARTNYISESELRNLAIRGLQTMITEALGDNLLSEQEDARILGLCKEFSITANDLGPAGIRFAKAEILRQLDDGQIPKNVVVRDLPINLENEESIVWLFNDAVYYTTRNRTEYVGRSQGVSIRVMKGVYYRVGAHRGEPIKTQYLSEEGRGIFVIASKNVYFWSPQKALKLRPKKILSVQPYSDGIQIMRDTASASPQFFKIDDPAFAADTIARLNQLQT